MGKPERQKSKHKIVVGSDIGSTNRIATWLRVRTHLILLAAAILVAGGIGVVIWQSTSRSSEEPTVSSQQFAEREADRLAKAVKDDSTDVETKIAQLQSLVFNEHRLGQDEKAKKHYEELLVLMKNREFSNESTYKLAASIYAALGDKAAATKQLDKAQSIVSKLADPSARQSAQIELNNAREAIL